MRKKRAAASIRHTVSSRELPQLNMAFLGMC